MELVRAQRVDACRVLVGKPVGCQDFRGSTPSKRRLRQAIAKRSHTPGETLVVRMAADQIVSELSVESGSIHNGIAMKFKISAGYPLPWQLM